LTYLYQKEASILASRQKGFIFDASFRKTTFRLRDGTRTPSLASLRQEDEARDVSIVARRGLPSSRCIDLSRDRDRAGKHSRCANVHHVAVKRLKAYKLQRGFRRSLLTARRAACLLACLASKQAAIKLHGQRGES